MATVAQGDSRQCRPHRSVHRLGRSRQLEHSSAVHLSSALRHQRSIVRQGHRIYLFSLPALVGVKNWALLTLVMGALFAGFIYWVHGDIEYQAQRRSISPTAISHGSALLGLFFGVKASSYALDRYLLLFDDNGVVV